MRVVVLQAALILLGAAGSAFAQGAPLHYDRSTGADAYTKDLSADGVWASDDIDEPSVGSAGTKSLNADAPTIHDFVLTTAAGTIVVSQLWDVACSASLCPTKVFLRRADGSVKILNDGDMMPQFDLQKIGGSYKDLSNRSEVELSTDGKSIVFPGGAGAPQQSFELRDAK